ncbi:histidine kinase [Tetragenococcus osmophilus]|uniref:Histidine kinase n=1 Tax=Tetragenococcus osmophilus TaxID=526944 RepID=A0AA37XIX7_9ENTE|nr:histidine kinase [Tetragenococcus osmophilus]AYW47067.1 histidine kinase [Tetragenococcus osmophilus]GMA55135.1 hypothetical protein GCM10025857_64920 [Alicyclobacillus contaminans]GMA71092.1 hypothetical protein GCM10025885_01410 [Tetragenococcus osmophilus]
MNLTYLFIIVIASIVLIFGFINIFAPKTGWWLEIGWRIKDAEPSHAALIMNRVSGGFMIIIASIIIYRIIQLV